MPSIIQGYEYDIFISYRQKDNKYDGWVTEFVVNLNKELEATFKEDVSVYFDINPHDGLLETHDVDESLKEKLKCLIFIPIISRTYCDPKAFAWEHEFKAFVEQASKDEFGLKVKLPNGNVASRVLPIVIYDLDKQDIKLFESVLGSVLRGVEFTYKTAGVNRPLRSKDDLIIESGKVFYRDQVNKVANTIKDILNSLTERGTSVEEAISETTIVDETLSTKRPIKKKHEIPSVTLLYRLKNFAPFGQKAGRKIAMILVIFATGFGIYWLGMKNAPLPDRPELKYNIPLPDYLDANQRKALTISSNGEYIVYIMNNELNLLQLNGDAPSIPISGTTNARAPFFSFDGKWIGFINAQERTIMKVPLTGGNPISICDLENTPISLEVANWYENEILYTDGRAIYRVPDSGGTPERLYPSTRSENGSIIWNPQLLPDKKTLLFSQQLEDGGWSIMTWQLGSKDSPVVVVERGRDGRYLKSGHIVYSLDNHLYTGKLHSSGKRIASEPEIIATDPVMENTLGNFGTSQFDFSDNGILVYYEQQLPAGQRNLAWVDESGEIDIITRDAKYYANPSISSDAQYIAVHVLVEGAFHTEIIDTKTGNSRLFAENAVCPSWSADNSSVCYISTTSTNQVFQRPVDDPSTAPAMLFEIDSANGINNLGNLSVGRYLPFDGAFNNGKWYLGYYDMSDNNVKMLDYYDTGEATANPAISPNGHWLAYRSNNDGQMAIYVAPFPGPGQPKKITSGRPADDIYNPIWAPDMKSLYYVTTSPDFELWRIDILASENNLDFKPAQPIFNGGTRFVFGGGVEMNPNGDRFLMFQNESAGEEGFEPRIKVIVNWEQELEGN